MPAIMSPALKLRFWLNMASVITTSYIIIWYIFKPSNNQCQMTFMMEPPMFIPVPTHEFGNVDSFSPSRNLEKSLSHENAKYKLYMYSEIGFPMPSDVQRDLKDSMPVLFVPGNAGSYQQVRSLASTCIRRQLQSLEAFKFIFYTIDFGGQLSGLDGGLIKSQILYVHQCLKLISKMHNLETNGVILIGHSVGGFISKALSTVPSFRFDSVPLLISLASPLTKPYLIFDDQMRELYDMTHQFWADEKRRNSTIALSISGGATDHLVPMHSSMDPQYDLAITTNSIKDVWLATDHVCITWCKELMHKLAQLLSALMDKKRTRLIDNRDLALSITKNLLLNQEISEEANSNVTHQDWRTIRPYVVEDVRDFYFASRLHLMNSIIILNLTLQAKRDMLIFINHIDTLKEDGIFGCFEVNSSSTQINCVNRVELMHLAVPIPSRRFEPKKKALRLKFSGANLANYIVLDFGNYALQLASKTGNKVPESITVQELDNSLERVLYIPSLLEFAVKKLLFIDSYRHLITHRSLPLVNIKMKLLNLRYRTQIYSIRYESMKCKSRTHNTNTPTLMITQDGYVSESFYPTVVNEDTSIVVVKLKSQKSVIIKGDDTSELRQAEPPYLELFIDGNCENHLQIQVDMLDLVTVCIQYNLGKILTSTTYLAYLSLVTSTLNSKSNQRASFGSRSQLIFESLGYILVFLSLGNSSSGLDLAEPDQLQDDFVTFLSIFALSAGLLAYLKYFVERIIDLANILNNARSSIHRKIPYLNSSHNSPSQVSDNPEVELSHLKSAKITAADLDWLLVGITIAGSVIFSTALISLSSLLMLAKLDLNIGSIRAKQNKVEVRNSSTNKHCLKIRNEVDTNDNFTLIHELVVSIAVLCVLALLANIPAALTQISSNKLASLGVMVGKLQRDVNFLSSTVSLLLVKLITERVGFDYANRTVPGRHPNGLPQSSGNWFARFIVFLPTNYLHLATLGPIMYIDTKLSNINVTLMIVLFWINIFMQKQQSKISNGPSNKSTR